MEFYADHLKTREPASTDLPLNAHYHTWTADSIARLWSIWANNPFLRSQYYPAHYFEALLAEARPHLGHIDVAADIGCGSGTVLSLFERMRLGRRLIGVDLSEESLAKVRAAFAGNDNCSFHVGSISRIPLDDGSCDLVVVTETLEHLFPEDFERGLNEIARVLKPGGRMLATLPIEETPAFVVCPECHAIFTPFQHMLFNFTFASLSQALALRGLDMIHIIRPIDTGVPRKAWKRFVKDQVLTRFFPGLTRRLFRVPGVTGFVARKHADAARP